MSVSLYRRYRPTQFNQIVGQVAAVHVITRALEERVVSHAYLFSGPRGCGKTTLARLLAKSLNCTSRGEGAEPCNSCSSCEAINRGESLDVIEIDGASNNSVDEIRELKTHVSLSPFASSYKVYIIDEVHMLSLSAFNALLKTLEEPPSHVVFILATTEPYKVPITIRSRCQHIPFRKIAIGDIEKHLKEVAVKEGRLAEEEALWEIARQSDGALRDALSLLEQVMALTGEEITMEAVDHLLGGGSRPELERWISRLHDGGPDVLADLQNMFRRGASPFKVVEDLFVVFRDLWITAMWGKGALKIIEGASAETEFLQKEARCWSPEELLSLMDFCVGVLPQVRMGMRTDVLSGLFLNKLMSLGTISHNTTMVSEEKKTTKNDILKGLNEEAPLPSASFTMSVAPNIPAKEEALVVSLVEETSVAKVSPEVPCDCELENKWEEVLTRLLDSEIHLHSALIPASVVFMNEEIHISLPEQCTYLFELLTIERNSFLLQRLIDEIFNGHLSLSFICGEKIIKREGTNEEKIDNVPIGPFFDGRESIPQLPFDDVPMPPSPSQELPEQDDDPLEEQTVFSGLVEAVLRLGGGEVLWVRKEEADELDGGLTEE